MDGKVGTMERGHDQNLDGQNSRANRSVFRGAGTIDVTTNRILNPLSHGF